MSDKIKVLVYKEALFTTCTTNFSRTNSSSAICTADTIIEVLAIQKNPYLHNNDRRDVLVIERSVRDGGKYLMVMPGSYEIKE